jgi:16S rRNA pseudouridine516 synthase
VGERLDAWLAHRGFGTRSEARDLVRSGAVAVDGEIVRDTAVRIFDERIAVRGVVVERKPDAATMVLHKPVGYSCSHDQREAPLIEDLVPPEWKHLAMDSAGRLDRDTSGLLIVTTDGALIHQLTNPRKKLTKRYRIGYRGPLSAHAVERCAKGMTIEGDPRPTLPAKLVLGRTVPPPALSDATLYLNEGRYHQVRRMIAELGGRVVTLHRDRIGRLELPADVPEGAMRPITPAELELLHASDDEGAVGEVG